MREDKKFSFYSFQTILFYYFNYLQYERGKKLTQTSVGSGQLVRKKIRTLEVRKLLNSVLKGLP